MAVTKKKTTQKGKPKKLAPVTKLICAILLVISAYLIAMVIKEAATTIRLQRELADVEEKYAQVQEENERLTDQKAKLQDPDYVESYARSNYNLSKEGEQIFYLR